MKTIAFHNLGCKVNSYEMDVMELSMQKGGWQIVDFDQIADVYVINTCSVTNIADRKSRQMLHRAKNRNADAVVVAAGCYVQADAFSISQDECVDLLIGNNRKAQIREIIEEYLSAKIAGTLPEYGNNIAAFGEDTGAFTGPGESFEANGKYRKYLIKTLGNTTIVDLKKVPFEDASITRTDSHTRAYIKIQDGCNRYCSYCIIPYTRGIVRSKPVDDVMQEVECLVSSGVREIVLTGIHISSYGVDFRNGTPAEHLLNLLRRMNAVEGLARIRLSSFEPRLITEEYVKGLSEIKKLCPHFHLSLQSGCDETLQRMNRKYTSAEYAERVAILRKYFPDAAITTDVIVGFPRETEKEFKTTENFCRQIGFYEMHVFKYSRRRGTPADADPEQVPEQVKNTRSDTLLELTEKQSAEFRKRWIGRTTEVLFEEEKEIDGRTYWTGFTKEYVRVAIFSSESLENRIVKVVPKEFLKPDLLLAEIPFNDL